MIAKNPLSIMHLYRLGFLIGAWMVCTLVPCYAQEVAKIKVRFVSFPKPANPQPVELITRVNEGKIETILVELPTNVISQVYEVDNPSSWTLGKTITNDKGVSVFKAYGTTRVLAAKEQLVFVHRKGKTDEDGFTLIPFEEQQSGFVGGKYLVFNAAKVDIACLIYDQKIGIKPLGHGLLAPAPKNLVAGKASVPAFLYYRNDKEFVPFHSSNWRFNIKARNIVICYHTEVDNSLRFHIIRDYVP